ncbi:hypothetical protein ACRARG_12660 [Pseudooceanicola sp. C21-150M6]|uniref:hypothetical protein n=1 Tax=Pseudooceanicola sp. C21-150M6 TaxID=3434355 RepID=UPI003D7F9DE0
MATTKHPLTGVILNDLGIRRKTLSYMDAVTAHILRLQGVTFTEIVHMLGTNARRIGEVFRGDLHPEAEAEAVEALRQSGTLLI